MTPNDARDEISTEFLARLLGLTPQRVGQLTQSGTLSKVGHGRYNGPDSVQAYISFKARNENERLRAADTTQDALKFEKTRKIKLENDERERTLVDTGNAMTALDVIVGMLRADLAGVPARVTDDVALRRQIEHAIDQALGGLADRFAKAGAALREGRDPDEADGEDDG
jgi:hypothetical protein